MIKKPYYNLHQIISGQFTTGNEFITGDGSDYVGEYHILPNGSRYTGSIPSEQSVQLFIKYFNVSNDVKIYNTIRDNPHRNYIEPVEVYPNISTDDRKKGKIERYFVQKRNNPFNTIIEIDYDQYNSVNKSNKIGIDSVIWNRIKIKWVISNFSANDALEYNKNEVLNSKRMNFYGLSNYILNYLEYYS